MSGYKYNDAALYVSGAMALSQSAYVSWGSGINDSTTVGFAQNANGTLLFKDNATGSWTEFGSSLDDMQLGDEASDIITVNGQLTASQGGSFAGDVFPSVDDTYNLGSSAKRWANLYTGDLHLKNNKGDWTILEEEDYLCVVNNKTNKKYKMMLEEIGE